MGMILQYDNAKRTGLLFLKYYPIALDIKDFFDNEKVNKN